MIFEWQFDERQVKYGILKKKKKKKTDNDAWREFFVSYFVFDLAPRDTVFR